MRVGDLNTFAQYCKAEVIWQLIFSFHYIETYTLVVITQATRILLIKEMFADLGHGLIRLIQEMGHSIN